MLPIIKFRNCFLNLTERRLIRDGVDVSLTAKNFDVLWLLIQRHGEIVTRDEILGQVWNGEFVEESNISVHISKLRRLLDGLGRNGCIETVQGVGYRFVATVEQVDSDAWERELKKSSPVSKDTARWRFPSVLVVPLINATEDPTLEYLVDGLTEDLINRLSRLKDLRVIGRDSSFRFKGKLPVLADIRDSLDIDAIVTGRIRVVNDSFQFGVELVNTADESQVWGRHYDLELSELGSFCETICHNLKDELTDRHLNSQELDWVGSSSNFESYRQYVKGKEYQKRGTKLDLNRAIECFKASALFDQLNYQARIEIVESLFQLYFSDFISHSEVLQETESTINSLVELSPESDGFYCMLGGKAMYLDWDFKRAFRLLSRSLTINPTLLLARYRFANLCLATNRPRTALEQIEVMIKADPLSVPNINCIARILYKMDRYDDAIWHLNEALELAPGNFVSLVLMAGCQAEIGRIEDAIDLVQQSLTQEFNLESLSILGYLHAKIGNDDVAKEIAAKLDASLDRDLCSGMRIGRIHLALGNRDLAIKYLWDGLNHHDVDLISLGNHPQWKSMKSDYRFKQVLERVGLPSA